MAPSWHAVLSLPPARPAHTVGCRQRCDACQADGEVGRMATFRAYAKVLEPDDPTMRIYEAGLRACPGEPGMPLAEVLRRSGGVYQTTTPLIPHMRDDIRKVAELTSDAELLVIAEMTEVPVSLEHLRGLDPQTRIVIVSELHYEADEGARVSRAMDRR